ncbi:hypothetical protein MITSMUL_03774 [Mitsuokella multacida DSM 20544]|uniref:Uncharacterized protein n=1 Tax=Mitsuokella multacida DSM 20544 TaxID=500635 RepID=C9KKS4_9FIRM|nr:hypothetical protein MITSMUL_03774 [Mitsuokella multacida DSM 20544]
MMRSFLKDRKKCVICENFLRNFRRMRYFLAGMCYDIDRRKGRCV